MPAPLDPQLRARVVHAVEVEKATIEATATRFAVGTATVKRLLKQWRVEGSLAARKPPGARRKLDVAGRVLLRGVIDSENDLFQWQIAEKLASEYGLNISRATVGREVARAGITRKKSR